MSVTVSRLCFGLILAGCIVHAGPPAVPAPVTKQGAAKQGAAKQETITQLKQRLSHIDTELETLASLTIRNGFSPIGIASEQFASAHKSMQIQVELAEVVPIDQIVLIPSLGRDPSAGLSADGFPIDFQVFAGSAGDDAGQLVAAFTEADKLLPRIAPLVINCATTASWVRVDVSQLAPHILNNNFILKLAEILVFSGSENVALRRPVSTVGHFMRDKFAQAPRFATDGFVPYLMDGAEGNRSSPLVSVQSSSPYEIIVDLGAPYSLNRIHLHAVYSSYSLPLYSPPDYCIPHQWRLQGAQQADFSDAKVLAQVRYASLLDFGPILMHPLQATPSRYIRFQELYPKIKPESLNKRISIGFAEIELFSEGVNVAYTKKFSGNFTAAGSGSGFESLSDGNNFYGNILPVRSWLNELARRHDLETERPLVSAALDQLYDYQKARLVLMRWLAILCAVGIAIAILVGRMIRMRGVIRLRERIAANLHDELSANLHAVALLGDMAQKNIDKEDKLGDILDRIQDLSKHSRNATRHCMDMLQAESPCDDLVGEITLSTHRYLADMEHAIHIEGEEFIQRLSPRKRLGVSLFYKECLINIVRHAQAHSCRTHLTGSPRQIRLEVSDDGIQVAEISESLKRRSELLGAQIQIDLPAAGGTHITLCLRTCRTIFPRKLKGLGLADSKVSTLHAPPRNET